MDTRSSFSTISQAALCSSTNLTGEVRFYADNMLIGSVTEAPYECVFTPTEKRTYSIMAIAINAEGKEKISKTRNLEIVSDTPLSIQTLVSDEPETPTYNMMGMPVNADYRGIVIKNGKKYVIK